MPIKKIHIGQLSNDSNEMSFLKKSTYNNAWVITRVSRDKLITIKQWIYDVDDEYWNIYDNINGVYILIGGKGDENGNDVKQTHYVWKTQDFQLKWNSNHKKLKWVKEIIFIRDLDPLKIDNLLFIEKFFIEVMLKNKLSVLNRQISKDTKALRTKKARRKKWMK